MQYKHKETGATYKPKKAVDGGVIFRVSGGNGDHQWIPAFYTCQTKKSKKTWRKCNDQKRISKNL